MSTITKQKVHAISDLKAGYTLGHADVAILNELARIALASLEEGAELQRKAKVHDALCKKYNVESLSDFVEWQRNHIAELEAAPPAPVGPGETAVMPDYPGYALTQRECFQAGKKAGLAEAGNSPVIADGWVACSERMPPEYEPVYIFHPDYGVSQYVWYDHQEDAFVWDDETRFRELESVSHWMAMPAPPAAPEQEDK
ncbi:DUF551 domain-containing protein [Enterobacter bugandensis]|uniref:DUF551 domain-containing protein n=1 Tax=Enterobacter bugandensis TaxID=881260 RepID=UPI002FD385EA